MLRFEQRDKLAELPDDWMKERSYFRTSRLMLEISEITFGHRRILFL
jgi:hypothetical protein